MMPQDHEITPVSRVVGGLHARNHHPASHYAPRRRGPSPLRGAGPAQDDCLPIRYLRRVAELAYDGKAKPGCGTKVVIRTQRGIELAEMLTTTCTNSGCSKSVSRKEMLRYIEASGGKDYPFHSQGKVLRIATADDLLEQSRLDSLRAQITGFAQMLIAEFDLPMKLVEIERLLGGEGLFSTTRPSSGSIFVSSYAGSPASTRSVSRCVRSTPVTRLA